MQTDLARGPFEAAFEIPARGDSRRVQATYKHGLLKVSAALQHTACGCIVELHDHIKLCQCAVVPHCMITSVSRCRFLCPRSNRTKPMITADKLATCCLYIKLAMYCLPLMCT